MLLFIFGSGSLKDFAFALIIGIASGAYSSIFIAAPLLAMFLEREPGFVKRRHDLERSGEIEAPEAAHAGRARADRHAGHRRPGAASAPHRHRPSSRRRRRRSHGRSR